jgi:hypothetical protein
MRGKFSVMPMMRTFSWSVRPHLALLVMPTMAPTSEQAAHPFFTTW